MASKRPKICLVCGRSFSGIQCRDVGGKTISKAYCIHESCLTPGLRDWCTEHGFLRNEKLLVYDFKKFMEIMKTPALQEIIGFTKTPKPNTVTSGRYSDENQELYHSPFWKRLRRWVMASWKHKCLLCGNTPEDTLEVHHISGDVEDSRWVNLMPLCGHHHRYLHDRVPYYNVPGFIVTILRKHRDDLPKEAWLKMFGYWDGISMEAHEALGKWHRGELTNAMDIPLD